MIFLFTICSTLQKKSYSNAHYVGYVEENESIEAIMKKFEELARMEEEFKKTSNTNTNTNGEGGSNGTINDTSSPLADGELVLGVEKVQTNDGHQGFTDEQLQEVFKRTSGFTVRSMMRDTPEDIYEEDVWQANIADEDYLYDFEEEEYVALSFFFLAHEQRYGMETYTSFFFIHQIVTTSWPWTTTFGTRK